MVLFSIIAALLLLLSVAVVLLALRGGPPRGLESNRERNIAIAKERRDEINSAFANGDLSRAEQQLALQDLSLALAEELSIAADLPHATKQPPLGNAPKASTPCIIIGMVLVAVGLYIQTGTFNYAALESPSLRQQGEQGQIIPSLEQLVRGLEAKVSENPDDERGLFLLAQTYNRLGRHQEAAAIYATLLDLVGPNADLLTEQAQAIVQHEQQAFTAQSRQLLNAALALQPHHIKARWLSGQGNLASGRAAAALEDWLWIAADLQADPAAHAQLQALIKDAELALGEQAASAKEAALLAIKQHLASAEHLQAAETDAAKPQDAPVNTPTIAPANPAQ